jgi:hypothetical protein
MAINFNALPTEKPAMGTIIPKGQYLGTIAKSEMKQGQDKDKPPYLSVEMDIVDEASNTSMGKLWAILTESEQPLPRYQLQRFIKALNLPITGEFELKDLTKMINGKSLIVDIVPEERTDGKEAQRSIVDVKSGDIFYPVQPRTTVGVAEEDTPFAMDTTPVNLTPTTMSAY